MAKILRKKNSTISDFHYCFECHQLAAKKTLLGGARALLDWHHPQVKPISSGAWQIGVMNIHGAGNFSVSRAVRFNSTETIGHSLLIQGQVQHLQPWAMSRQRQHCFLPFALYETHTSRGGTLPCIHTGKRRPW